MSPIKAVIYARYSSDNQREESIDAQIRLRKEFEKVCLENPLREIEQYFSEDEYEKAREEIKKSFDRFMKWFH